MARRGSRWGALLRAGALLLLLLSSIATLAAAEENAPGTTGVLEASVGGKRTLVLADGPQIQDTHSMFFAALKVSVCGRGCRWGGCKNEREREGGSVRVTFYPDLGTQRSRHRRDCVESRKL